jgi:MoxR-like ATPase
MSTRLQAADFQTTLDDLTRLRHLLEMTIVGQEQLITELLTAVFAAGHVLLEGPPGLGKTHLAKALASSMGFSMSRIQCTPDLMPADITGSEVLAGDDTGRRQLNFRPGPLFAPMVLVDEINRATPKTQAAFLEAMQENQVTCVGTQYDLPKPFWVLATQNPIELEGTYALPEAQVDRFLFKLIVPYPSAENLLSMLEISLDDEPADHITPILSPDRVNLILAQAREIVIAGPLKQAAVNLTLATHPDSSQSHPLAREHITYGASPRGLQSMLRAARVRALMNGRAHVAMDDLREVALPSLRHRVLLRIESEMDGIKADTVLEEIVTACISKQQ